MLERGALEADLKTVAGIVEVEMMAVERRHHRQAGNAALRGLGLVEDGQPPRRERQPGHAPSPPTRSRQRSRRGPSSQSISERRSITMLAESDMSGRSANGAPLCASATRTR